MSSFPNVLEETLTTRSTSFFFDKTLCIICQIPGGVLNRVEFKVTGLNMLDISSKPPDKTFFRRLNSISIAEDAAANDVIYQNHYWVKTKKKAVPKQKPAENYIITLSNVKILNHMEMNKLNELYKKMLAERRKS